MLKSGKKLESD